MDFLQWAIVAFIVISILWHVWRGGQANPDTTGSLGRRIGKLSVDVTAASASAARAEERSGMVDHRLSEIERVAVKRADLVHFEKQFAALEQQFGKMADTQGDLRVAVAEHKATSEHTRLQVDRLYNFVVQKGIES